MKLIDKLLDKVVEALDKWLAKHADWAGEEERAEEGRAAAESEPSETSSASTENLVWKFGGVDGSRATEDPSVRIGSLKSTRSGLSYAWESGTSLRAWGLADGDAEALACAFYRSGDIWIGGKFDWISTSRRSRDYKNIDGRYHGWDPDAFFAASEHGFCILSKDGKKRSNFIACKV